MTSFAIVYYYRVCHPASVRNKCIRRVFKHLCLLCKNVVLRVLPPRPDLLAVSSKSLGKPELQLTQCSIKHNNYEDVHVFPKPREKYSVDSFVYRNLRIYCSIFQTRYDFLILTVLLTLLSFITANYVFVVCL